MSTPPPTSQVPPASGAVRLFVPAYLLVVGLGLVLGSVYLFTSYGDEQFTAVLSLLGGLTMWVTALSLVTLGRRG